MIDNLTDAIAHAREVAREKRAEEQEWRDKRDFIESNERNPKGIYDLPINQCKECAKEHEQLAEWLTELQERREADRWIPVSERLPDERDWYLGLFKEPDTGFIGLPYICDYVGEITKGTTKEGWILRHCTDVDNASDYFRNLIFVAWQPLPEPYKEGGAEE